MSNYPSYEECMPVLPVRFFRAGDAAKTDIRSEIVDAEAEKDAKAFVTGKDKIKASQLRKFYSTAKAIELSWRTNGGDAVAFGTVLPRIKLMKAKVVYAKGRNVVPACFASWMTSCVDAVSDFRDFEAFLLHFEAVVGFAYGHGLKD